MKITGLFLLTLFSITSNGQTWLWAKSAGGSNYDYSNSISTDANGNSYVTGRFQSDSITFGSNTLTNAGSGTGYSDIFIVKYDDMGNVVWAKSAGGGSNDCSNSIHTDTIGNSYITGYFFSDTITFGSITLINSGENDIFVAKYDSSGNVVWAISAGGTGDDRGGSISTDINGNSYVTGLFISPSITFGSTTLTNAGGSDFFILKLDNLGNVVWAKNAGGNMGEVGSSISTDASGNIYVTGNYFSSAIVFGSDTLTNVSHYDIFIVKYDNSGNVVWAKSAGGTGNDYSNCISTDAIGNTYLTGNFGSATINFDTITLTNNYSNYFDVFVAKYDNSGNIVWAKSAEGTTDDVGTGIIADSNGNSFVTGYFSSPTITFNSFVLTNATNYINDVFVVKYDVSGNVIWTQRTGGINRDEGNSISANANGNIYVTGFFNSNTILGTTNLISVGLYDIFIAKLNSVTGISKTTDNGENSVLVFPNPFSTHTTIQTNKIFKDATLTIYNLYGQTVKQIKNIYVQTITLHRDNLPSGLYFLRLTQNNKVIAIDKLLIIDK